MTQPKVFTTPYLRYSNATELGQIHAQLRRIQFAWARRHPVSAEHSSVPASIKVDHGDPGSTVSTATDHAAQVRTAMAPAAAGAKAAIPETVIRAGQGKAAQNLVTITPSGVVPLGFNCTRSFDAVALSGAYGDEGYWSIQFSAKLGSQAQWVDSYFLGADAVSAVGKSTISFTMDMSSYGTQALSGQIYFRLVWTEPTISGWIPWYSDPVTLDFNVPPCNSIHHVNLLVDGVDYGASCSVVGSENHTNPELRVTLAAPAKPGGETIRVKSSNTTYGWIMQSGGGTAAYIDMVVPAGGTTGALSWFVGTKHVLTTGKSFNLVSQLVYPDGQLSSGEAYATVTLLKK